MIDRLEDLRAGRPLLPLTRGQADVQAMRLRAHGMSYPQLAVVMSLYHDDHRSDHAWRHVCRRQGAVPVYHGRPLERVA